MFTPGKPVRGGRAVSFGKSAEAPGAVELASQNNFQGRYIIRHYWEGAVECERPQWGRWGGPPDGSDSTKAATGLASAPRGRVVLDKVVTSALPQLDLVGLPAPKHPKRPKRK